MKFVVAHANELQVTPRGEKRDKAIADLAAEVEGSLQLRALYRQALKARVVRRSFLIHSCWSMSIFGGNSLMRLYLAIKALTMMLLVAQLFVLQVNSNSIICFSLYNNFIIVTSRFLVNTHTFIYFVLYNISTRPIDEYQSVSYRKIIEGESMKSFTMYSTF